jgi:hypothetical protein
MLSALFTAFHVAPYVMAVLLGVLVPLLGVVCYSHFGVGLAFVCGMFAIEALYMFVGGVQLGITVYYTDFVLVFIGVVGGLRWLMARDMPRRHGAWVLYVLTFFVSLGTGLLAYGSGAGVQSRGYAYSVMVGTYAMSFAIDERRVRLLVNALVWIAVLLIGLCAYRWVVYYTPIRELLPEEGVYNTDGAIRVVRSYEAVVLGQVFVVALFFGHFSRGLASRGLVVARLFSPLLLAVVAALQHRSVWLAVIVGVFASVFVVRSKSGSRLGQVLLLALIVGMTALPLVLSDQLAGLGTEVSGSAARAVGGEGSVGERLDNWKGLIQLWYGGGPRSIAIGQSFGSDATRYVQDKVRGGEHKIEYFAHNYYVQTLYNMGVVGLAAFVTLLVYAVGGLYRLCANGQGGTAAEVLLVLCIMQAAYYVPYGTDYLQSLILGVAAAFVATQKQRAATLVGAPAPLRSHARWGMA